MILLALALVLGAVAGFLLRDVAGCATCDALELGVEDELL